MKSIDPVRPWSEIREFINRTAEELPAQAGYDTLHGHGRVDVLRALAATKYNAEVADSVYDDIEEWTYEQQFPNVYLPGDVLVTNSGWIDVGAGTQVYAAATDRHNLGSDDEKVEIIVHGTFQSESGPGTFFLSARGTPEEGDWWGIRVFDDGVIWLDDCEIKHSNFGAFVDAGSGYQPPGHILNSTFTDNSRDITVEGTGEFLVSGNHLTVDSGWGMAIRDGGGGVTISGNTVVGTSYSALNGISIGPKWIAPTVTDNTVYGFGIGYAIAQYNGVATFTENKLKGSKHGILVAGGTATIGTTSSSSDNNFKHNTMGILVDELLTVNSGYPKQPVLPERRWRGDRRSVKGGSRELRREREQQPEGADPVLHQEHGSWDPFRDRQLLRPLWCPDHVHLWGGGCVAAGLHSAGWRRPGS
jgi:hypothetical protein